MSDSEKSFQQRIEFLESLKTGLLNNVNRQILINRLRDYIDFEKSQNQQTSK